MYKNVYITLYNVNIIQLMYKNCIVHGYLICKIGGVYGNGEGNQKDATNNHQIKGQ